MSNYLHIETCAKIKIIKGFAHQSSTKVARCVSEQNTLKWQRDLYNTVCVTQYPANCQKLFRLYVSSFLSVFKKKHKIFTGGKTALCWVHFL